ncbi:hypothetical protein FRC02_009867 [Tulasnella sp. 418]|nr:hypothetical protein FRC02_009867 [Tulasnella sp. 418]
MDCIVATRSRSFCCSIQVRPAVFPSAKRSYILFYSAESIGKDLTTGVDKPTWPFSSYGPAKGEATYIVGVDMSPEEMRLRAYEAKSNNQFDQYVEYEKTQEKVADDIFADRRKNTTETYKHAVGGNTFSAVNLQQSSSSFGMSGMSSAFDGPGTTSSAMSISGFGGPSNPAFGGSTFGQSQAPTSAFGQSAFGKQPATSAFGQSAFGNAPPTSAFGSTSQSAPAFGATGFGASTSNSAAPAFGQTGFGSTSAAPAFGASTGGGGFSAFAAAKPTAFGASSFGQSGFATAAQSQSNTTQPAPAFGSGGSGGGGFGAFANPSSSTAFGSTSTSTTAPAQTAQPAPPSFGQTGFGQTPAAPVSAFGGQSQPPPAFASQAPAAPPPAFGQQPQQPTSAFGATSAFGQSAFSRPAGFAGFGGQPPPPPPPAQPQPEDSSTGKLPPNYLEVLPQQIKDAFAREDEFEWMNVPEWIPPLEMR